MNSKNHNTDLTNRDGAIDNPSVDTSRRSSDIYQRFINRVKQIEGEEYNDIDAENKAQAFDDKNISDHSFDYNVPIDDSEDDGLADHFLEEGFAEDGLVTDYQQPNSQSSITDDTEQEESSTHTVSATTSVTAEHQQSAYSEVTDNEETVQNIEPVSRIPDYKRANDSHQLQKKALSAQSHRAPKHKTSFKLLSIGLLSGVLLSAATILVLTKKDIFSTSISTPSSTADTAEMTEKPVASDTIEITDNSSDSNNDALQPSPEALANETNSANDKGKSEGENPAQPLEPVATYTDTTNQPAMPSDSANHSSNNETPISLDDFLEESKSTLYRESTD